MTNLGKRVQDGRLAAGLSQGDLAERAGFARAAISRIERRETHERASTRASPSGWTFSSGGSAGRKIGSTL
jgi:transcriptional regulator with XRE-family HTH domain